MLHIIQCSRHLESQLKELYVIFASDKYHKNVVPGVPIIGFKNSKKLKSYLLRELFSQILMRKRYLDYAMERDLLVNYEVI